VKLLLHAASRCEQTGPDAKAEALLDWLYRLQSEEADTELKALVFTEFVPTQEMLREFLSDRGFSVVCLNGSMTMEERGRAQEVFADDARILLSTDAGGEGLNLQFCHVVINYDIPWNPMRLEQRIGRVDRIGQSHTVRAVNLVFEDSVEHRVREVLEEKLAVILEEFGIDKTGDVLDSAESGRMFDALYVEAIVNPETLDVSIQNIATDLRNRAQESRGTTAILGGNDDLRPDDAQTILSHPLSHWVEHMTVSYLRSHNGTAERTDDGWHLIWPDNHEHKKTVFSLRKAEKSATARHLTLEDSHVRSLTTKLPRFVHGQVIPSLELPGLSRDVNGMWSIWSIVVVATSAARRRFMPLFIGDSGEVYHPAANRIWDLLTTTDIASDMTSGLAAPDHVLERFREIALQHGRAIYDGLVLEHKNQVSREQSKAEYAIEARRRSINRIGLPEVRNHRLRELEHERHVVQERLARLMPVRPELEPLLMLRVKGLGDE
jgi:hypothetical protein